LKPRSSFQFTLLRWERRTDPFCAQSNHVVSIHAPAGERRANRWFAARYNVFQFTLPQGSDGCLRGWRTARRCFNPRSREGSDPKLPRSFSVPGLFQSTLPRWERHAHRGGAVNLVVVSIHAPAKGSDEPS